jgi:hypothetical protein
VNVQVCQKILQNITNNKHNKKILLKKILLVIKKSNKELEIKMFIYLFSLKDWIYHIYKDG